MSSCGFLWLNFQSLSTLEVMLVLLSCPCANRKSYFLGNSDIMHVRNGSLSVVKTFSDGMPYSTECWIIFFFFKEDYCCARLWIAINIQVYICKNSFHSIFGTAKLSTITNQGGDPYRSIKNMEKPSINYTYCKISIPSAFWGSFIKWQHKNIGVVWILFCILKKKW